MDLTASVLPLIVASPFVGSFLGLLVVRLPRRRPVLIGRSACVACERPLGPYELVPALSWLVQRGRSRCCNALIGWFYPAMELAALGIALWSMTVLSGWPFWATCALGWCLLVLACIDWRHFILPDVLTLPLIPAGFGVAFALDPNLLVHHMAGAAAGFFVFWVIARSYRLLRERDGIGFGDVKLMAAGGAWLSWTGLPSMVLLATLSALAIAFVRAARGTPLSATDRTPFGTHLCAAFWVVWLYGPISL